MQQKRREVSAKIITQVKFERNTDLSQTKKSIHLQGKFMNTSTTSPQAIQLHANFYLTALSNVSNLIRLPGISPVTRELATLAKKFLESTNSKGLLSESPLTAPDSAFFKFSYTRFTELAIFQLENMAPKSCEEQIFSLCRFMYAAAYEAILCDEATVLHNSILLALQEHRSEIPDNVLVNIEACRGQITAHYAISRQSDLRKEIQAEFADAKNLLTPLRGQIDGWNHELSTWETKFNELKAFVVKQHSDLNFVGLSLAFSRLANQKKRELFVQILVAILLVMLLIGAIGYPGYLILTQKLEFATVLSWATHASPVIALELLLLYFFRITLRNYYSIKAQLLQLDLRYSLCAFIEGYADFAKRMKNSPEDKTLDRFESIVFSGITADIDKIPGQFDGIEQLATLLKAVRGESK